jgi:hypothetical protein
MPEKVWRFKSSHPHQLGLHLIVLPNLIDRSRMISLSPNMSARGEKSLSNVIKVSLDSYAKEAIQIPLWDKTLPFLVQRSCKST